MTHDYDDSSLPSSEDDDLDGMLSNLDIDKDFNVWTSVRMSSVGSHVGHEVSLNGEIADDPSSTPPAAAAAAATSNMDAILEKQDKAWSKRISRDEVYSHLYHPSVTEKAELDDLQVVMGIKKPNSVKNFFVRGNSQSPLASSVELNQLLLCPSEQTTSSRDVKASTTPSSILLKRGPCLFRQNDEASDTNHGLEVESEVLLLTHGLIVATIVQANQRNAVRRQFSRAILCSQVLHVQPVDDNTMAWRIVFKVDHPEEAAVTAVTEVWTFSCTTAKQQSNWLKAMERVIVEHHMHVGPQRSDLGWQYRYIHKPAFTMAVTDRVDQQKALQRLNQNPKQLDKLDRYNGFAPLHYAVRCRNLRAVQSLLAAGADPNQPDRDDERTPTDYAFRDHAPPAIQELLLAHGGKRTVEDDSKCALFGQVGLVQEKRAVEKRELEQKKKAEAAALEMHQNMRLLHERGEKIEELGNKATELNQGAQDFAAMAKQLKEKSKKDSYKWLPFM